jgi:NADH-quinone oxidoreductase subunit A
MVVSLGHDLIHKSFASGRMTPTSLVAYLALFAAVGFAFVFASLLLGFFLRPRNPTPTKLDTYECGEPPVGTSYVQFDLRFYVVALLFIIFEVEMAFFFPWATVFGKAVQFSDPGFVKVKNDERQAVLTPAAEQKLREFGVPESELRGRTLPIAPQDENSLRIGKQARVLAAMGILDIGVFFAVLLVGFAYVWYRGDLDWVRATGRPTGAEVPSPGQSMAPSV